MRAIQSSILACFVSVVAVATADIKEPSKEQPATALTAENFSGLKLREIGPAVTSGRVADLAVDPTHPSTWYVAVASGGVWKTTNSGTTWTPLFDHEGSYSIGCVTIDPSNPSIIWVGTGENNSQRSVSFGDGVYKSLDGGKNWKNTGLKTSEHIGKIIIDPRNSDVVYAASQGPLWSPGGERGLYKTTDGGKTWKPSLTISENTGVSDIWMDPRDSKILYATSYQRRRHVWGMIHGGPEGAIWKSTDAGASWRKLEQGIPKVDLGRIGLAIAPAKPDVVYALIEATDAKDRGTYRSEDRGESWKRVGEYSPNGPQYYQELVPDPLRAERIYSLDTYNHVSEDGGKTWKRLGEKYKHVDNHALWIDPSDTNHLINGNDGGVYESWDRGVNWQFKANLPVAQFYRVNVDESLPFYNVYGGAQDNNSLGGPSRTTSAHGIVNSDWFVTTGGDGFACAVDPTNPNIVYSESQYGVLVRFDRKTGEEVPIQPQAEPGEAQNRWNWDSPLRLSPHSPSRLYFASQRLYRSDDHGDHWTPVSPDLTRQIDRSALKIMGKVWSVDAVARNTSTSFYGNCVAVAESPKAEGLLYVGTDDGLVNISEDGGKNWRRCDSFPGIPANTYVSHLEASPFDADTVYATFENHKQGDFQPYALKSADRGKTWTSIVGNLPARGYVHTIIEDPAKAGLLYAGTEFGLYFSPDAGAHWVQLKGGLPTIAVRDLVVQKREGDLVAATFGRGFFVLDDLTPLRAASEQLLSKETALLPVRKAWMFMPRHQLGWREKAFQGAAYYTAPNPPEGAVFTFFLKDELQTRKKLRLAEEKKATAKGTEVAVPTWDALKLEDREEAPSILLTVSDSSGNVVRRLSVSAKAGFNRVAWDLRYPASNPATVKGEDEEDDEDEEMDAPRTAEDEPDEDIFSPPKRGPLALPGTYSVRLEKRIDGQTTSIGEAVTFTTELLGTASLTVADRAKVGAFAQKTARLQRAVLGAVALSKDAHARLKLLTKALTDTPSAPATLVAKAHALDEQLKDIDLALNGDPVLAKYQEPAPTSITERVDWVVQSLWTSTSAPTGTAERAYEIAADQFKPVLAKLKLLLEGDLHELEAKAEAEGAPWTPGRIPNWTKG